MIQQSTPSTRTPAAGAEAGPVRARSRPAACLSRPFRLRLPRCRAGVPGRAPGRSWGALRRDRKATAPTIRCLGSLVAKCISSSRPATRQCSRTVCASPRLAQTCLCKSQCRFSAYYWPVTLYCRTYTNGSPTCSPAKDSHGRRPVVLLVVMDGVNQLSQRVNATDHQLSDLHPPRARIRSHVRPLSG